jgi:hypothetical protein
MQPVRRNKHLVKHRAPQVGLAVLQERHHGSQEDAGGVGVAPHLLSFWQLTHRGWDPAADYPVMTQPTWQRNNATAERATGKRTS